MTADYTTTITVNASRQRAFDAINDVPGWWGRITGSTTAVGDEFVYVVPGLHYSGFRVVELEPARRIVWTVTGSYIDVAEHDKYEWNGTTVRFEIGGTDEAAEIVFTHEGLDPEVECYSVCSTAWAMFVNSSLKAFIETGTGAPYGFGGDEALSEEDHLALHREAVEATAQAAGAR